MSRIPSRVKSEPSTDADAAYPLPFRQQTFGPYEVLAWRPTSHHVVVIQGAYNLHEDGVVQPFTGFKGTHQAGHLPGDVRLCVAPHVA